mmetsp:Transcript_19095/g.1678  ORF Transcript_19095/g.1678 Transcript_19095/m.1678 type:complete len:82 (-) Transcript_19095:82-327(-)
MFFNVFLLNFLLFKQFLSSLFHYQIPRILNLIFLIFFAVFPIFLFPFKFLFLFFLFLLLFFLILKYLIFNSTKPKNSNLYK